MGLRFIRTAVTSYTFSYISPFALKTLEQRIYSSHKKDPPKYDSTLQMLWFWCRKPVSWKVAPIFLHEENQLLVTIKISEELTPALFLEARGNSYHFQSLHLYLCREPSWLEIWETFIFRKIQVQLPEFFLGLCLRALYFFMEHSVEYSKQNMKTCYK